MKTSRRNFLKVSSLLTGGLALKGLFVDQLIGQDIESTINFAPNVLMELDAEGIVYFKYTRHEMGQGSFTGLSMIFADELGADWNKFKASQADFNLSYGDRIYGNTGGSGTVRKMWQPLREMAAKARLMLTKAAAQAWNVPVNECIAENSQVIHTPSQRKLGFGELAAKAGKLAIPKEAPLKKLSELKYVGKPLKNLNIDKIIRGQLAYSINVQVPNMVYAAIVRAPVYGAKVRNFDASEVLKMKGVLEVVEISERKIPNLKESSPHAMEGVAIIANSTWLAFEAQKLLKVNWDEGQRGQYHQNDIAQKVEQSWENEQRIDYSTGQVTETLENAKRTFSATYINPHQAHALMEPLSATAHIEKDQCEIWTSMQHPHQTLERIAPIVGIAPENFLIHNLPCGGSFGRRFYEDYVTEAVYLAKVMKRPVKVTWSREDEIKHDGFHPYQHIKHTVALDDRNNILAWESLEAFTKPADEAWIFPINFYFDKAYHHGTVGMDRHLQTMAWRSVDAHPSALGMESFVDELAAELGKEPLQFRLDLLRNHEPAKNFSRKNDQGISDFLDEVVRPKAIRVYEKIEELGLMRKDTPPGTGIGIAGFPFGPTFCAEVAEVASIQGKIHIKKITCVVDCGLVINPQLAAGQIEGSVIWGLSALKYNNITMENGRVQQSNFHDYPILRIDEVPEIEVIFLERAEDPVGTGEPGVPPLAPAVLNAIYAATGQRIRHLPLIEENILA